MVRGMVKVTFKPWEEIVIHDSIQYELDDLVSLLSVGVQPGGLGSPLNWAQGVAFRHISMHPTDEVIREELQGRLHWSSVTWALMPKYKNPIVIPTVTRARALEIPIFNVSTNTILCDVAKALKKQAHM